MDKYEKQETKNVKAELDKVFADENMVYRDGFVDLFGMALSGKIVHAKGVVSPDGVSFYGKMEFLAEEQAAEMECNCSDCRAERGE